MKGKERNGVMGNRRVRESGKRGKWSCQHLITGNWDEGLSICDNREGID